MGGPRFQDIVDKYDNPSQPEDDDDDSGEGRRLDGGSSLRGSSSALTGVGAAHQVSGSAGGAKSNNTRGAIHASQIESLPAYSQHLEQDEGAPLLTEDADMNDGIDVGDEGIGLEPQHPYVPAWDFQNLSQESFKATEIGSDTAFDPSSDRSDIAAHDSSADAESLTGRLEDFNNAPVDFGDDYEPPTDVPDLDEESLAAHVGLDADLREIATQGLSHGNHDSTVVNVQGSDQVMDGPAAEIHVEEGEGLGKK